MPGVRKDIQGKEVSHFGPSKQCADCVEFVRRSRKCVCKLKERVVTKKPENKLPQIRMMNRFVFVHPKTLKTLEIDNGRSLWEDHIDKMDFMVYRQVGVAREFWDFALTSDGKDGIAILIEEAWIQLRDRYLTPVFGSPADQDPHPVYEEVRKHFKAICDLAGSADMVLRK